MRLKDSLNEGQCQGAALMLSFLLDLFSVSKKDNFTRDEILLCLTAVGELELPKGLLDRVKEYGDAMDKGEEG